MIRKLSKVFISYRRDDSIGHTKHLYDDLERHFPGQIFMALDTVQPGEKWLERITTALESSKVFVAVIGTNWLTSSEGNSRRLDNPDDYVRLEIATALSRGITIIPVLINGATLPRKEDLPEELKQLTHHHALEISDARWKYDVSRLIQSIEKELRPDQPIKFIVISLVIGLLLIGAIGFWLNKSRANSPGDVPTLTPSPLTTTTPLPPEINSNTDKVPHNQKPSPNENPPGPDSSPISSLQESITPKTPQTPLMPPWQSIKDAAQRQFSGYVEDVVRDNNFACDAGGCRVLAVLPNSDGTSNREPVMVTYRMVNGSWNITAKRLR